MPSDEYSYVQWRKSASNVFDFADEKRRSDKRKTARDEERERKKPGLSGDVEDDD